MFISCIFTLDHHTGWLHQIASTSILFGHLILSRMVSTFRSFRSLKNVENRQRRTQTSMLKRITHTAWLDDWGIAWQGDPRFKNGGLSWNDCFFNINHQWGCRWWEIPCSIGTLYFLIRMVALMRQQGTGHRNLLSLPELKVGGVLPFSDYDCCALGKG
jgi:hypothetical protein